MSRHQRRTLLDIASSGENDRGSEKMASLEEDKMTPLSLSVGLSSPGLVSTTVAQPVSVNSVPTASPTGSYLSANGNSGQSTPISPTTNVPGGGLVISVKKSADSVGNNAVQDTVPNASPSINVQLATSAPTGQYVGCDGNISTKDDSPQSNQLPKMPQRGRSQTEPKQLKSNHKGYLQTSNSDAQTSRDMPRNGGGGRFGSKPSLQTILEPEGDISSHSQDSEPTCKDGATSLFNSTSEPSIICVNDNLKESTSSTGDATGRPTEPSSCIAKRSLHSKFSAMPGAQNQSMLSALNIEGPRRSSLPLQPTFRYNVSKETISMEAPDVIIEPDNYSSNNTAQHDSHSTHLDHDLDMAAQILSRKPSDTPDTYSDIDINGEFNKSVSSVTSDGSRKSYDGKKRKSSYWYSVLSPNYKSKCEDFKKLFKDIPNEERLVVDYSCALQKDILVHGRLYVTQNWLCFYANIFRWETNITIRCKDIISMTKEKTARVIPNAIQVCTKTDKMFLTSFGSRDKTYLMLFRVWQNALLDQPMSPQELWQWVHYSYGEELGLTSSDDDYIPPSSEGDKASDNQVSPTDSSLTKPPCVEESRILLSPDDGSYPAGELTLSKDQLDGGTAAGDSNSISRSPDRDRVPETELTDGDIKQDLSLDSSEKIRDADIPTDLTDNTDDSIEGEAPCSGHTHFNIMALNEVFHIPVDQMFNHLFTDSPFFHDMTKSRKTFDLVLSPWQDSSSPDGDRHRMITYTLSLNSSLGPKTSAATEKQTCYGYSKPSVTYVVDTETTNSGIPYGESFYVVSRYCIKRVTSQKCRLNITSEIKYKKSVWGMVKSFIEKNCKEGIHDYFRELGVQLRREAEKVVAGAEPPKKKKLRKRRGTSEGMPQPCRTPEIPASTLPSIASKTQQKEEWSLKLNAESLVRILSILLIVLVLFNAVLYYKLCALETKAMYSSPGRSYQVNLENMWHEQPKSQEDWLQLLKQQQNLHDLELERWKEILTSSIELIEKMKVTLVDLKTSIDISPKDSSFTDKVEL